MILGSGKGNTAVNELHVLFPKLLFNSGILLILLCDHLAINSNYILSVLRNASNEMGCADALESQRSCSSN